MYVIDDRLCDASVFLPGGSCWTNSMVSNFLLLLSFSDGHSDTWLLKILNYVIFLSFHVSAV